METRRGRAHHVIALGHQMSLWGGSGCLSLFPAAGSVGLGAWNLGSVSICSTVASFQPADVSREELNEATQGLGRSPDTYYLDEAPPAGTRTDSQVSWIILDLPVESCSSPF